MSLRFVATATRLAAGESVDAFEYPRHPAVAGLRLSESGHSDQAVDGARRRDIGGHVDGEMTVPLHLVELSVKEVAGSEGDRVEGATACLTRLASRVRPFGAFDGGRCIPGPVVFVGCQA